MKKILIIIFTLLMFLIFISVIYSNVFAKYTMSQDIELTSVNIQIPKGVFAKLYDCNTDGIGETLVLNNTKTFNYNGILINDYNDIDNVDLGSNNVWRPDSSNITKIDILNEIVPTSTAYWFEHMTNLTDINNIKNLNTSKCTYMHGMFYKCSSLSQLDLSHFDTSNAKLLFLMFYGCSSLTNIDISNFDLSNATNIYSMFYGCSSLNSLNFTSWQTPNLTSLNSLFYNCTNLKSLNLSSFNVSNVKNFDNIFYGCSSLETLNLTNWNTINATSMNYLFFGCKSLKQLDLSFFNTSRVGSMYYTFANCNNLKTIFASNNFSTNSVLSSTYMFYNCNSIIGGKGTAFDPSLIDKTYARIDNIGQAGYFTKK